MNWSRGFTRSALVLGTLASSLTPRSASAQQVSYTRAEQLARLEHDAARVRRRGAPAVVARRRAILVSQQDRERRRVRDHRSGARTRARCSSRILDSPRRCRSPTTRATIRRSSRSAHSSSRMTERTNARSSSRRTRGASSAISPRIAARCTTRCRAKCRTCSRPDKKREAFVSKYNVYVRPRGGGDSTQLTTDGVRYWSYGLTDPRPSELQRPQPRRPQIRWSPDSKKLIVARNDERNVGLMSYISYTPQRPKVYSQPYALPGRFDRTGAGLSHHRRRGEDQPRGEAHADAESAHDRRLRARLGVERDVRQGVRHVVHARFEECVSRVGRREDRRGARHRARLDEDVRRDRAADF